MFASIQVMMWKKCFFLWLCLVREERIWNNVNFSWSHVLVACFVTVNYDFILLEFHKTFSIITCVGFNIELAVWSRESQLHDWGRGLLLVISVVVVVVEPPPPPPPSPRRHFQSMIVLGSGVLSLLQWSAMSWAETPTVKYSLKILQLLFKLTKPKKFKIN